MVTQERAQSPWWATAVVYEIYVRSFADSDGDGIGDIGGIRSRLDYLKQLGIDAIWVSPWYPSPQKDNGYDVTDYFEINPEYGTLAEAEMLISECHKIGLKLIIDIVPNHSSSEHVWFNEALSAAPGSAPRDRYLFRDGLGASGEIPPNNWQSIFGGPAWTRIVEADGTPGQWYCHLFSEQQPDFNWQNPEVRTYFENVVRFWLDRGVDGIRIDVAHGLVKAEGLPDTVDESGVELLAAKTLPFFDQDGVHEIYRDWRKILNSYQGDRMAVAEAWVFPASRIAKYVRHDELHNSFNFDFLCAAWDPIALRNVIDSSIEAMDEVGAPPSWVFNNHDVVRSVDRFALGLIPGSGKTTLERLGDPVKLDLQTGTNRARAAALLMLALPGVAYLYQGEELALPEVRDIPESRIADPMWRMSGFTDRGRDGCRVPIPWTKDSSGGFGFSEKKELRPDDAWLPEPAWWGEYSVEVQSSRTRSTLELYRKALALRRFESGPGEGDLQWIEVDPTLLAFKRGESFACYLNFGKPFSLPAGAEVLLASAPIVDHTLPTDSAAWLRLG
ncbi:oligo-1,6-glucosidase [mine drainage metagenome]|uniref:Oligo-1,6-glucosidase n=1 Tax=mine drainage metagenome TaxID=410659 RepID=A0A1J5QYP0_9ZZZZ